MDVWVRKDEKGRLLISTSNKETKPVLIVPIKEDEWIKISLEGE